MKQTVFLFLFCIAGFVKSQDTVIDSAEAKIEKYYNIDLPDSVRSHLKSQIDHMNKYIAQDSSNPKAFLQRGIYYGQLGAQVKAIENYDKTIQLDSLESVAYFNRGLAKGRFRYTLDACLDLKKAFKLGIQQAGEIYESYCRIYHSTIEKSVVSK